MEQTPVFLVDLNAVQRRRAVHTVLGRNAPSRRDLFFLVEFKAALRQHTAPTALGRGALQRSEISFSQLNQGRPSVDKKSKSGAAVSCALYRRGRRGDLVIAKAASSAHFPRDCEGPSSTKTES